MDAGCVYQNYGVQNILPVYGLRDSNQSDDSNQARYSHFTRL